jgi:catechol 2,3-dioxygenase
MIPTKQKPTLEKQRTTLSPLLELGSIELNIKDLGKMKYFYHEVMGLDILDEGNEKVTLGVKNLPLITLYHRKDLPQGKPEHAGLYHFAIVFASRADLAHMIYRILKTHSHHFSGSADHLVSEAFYFTDPEGNGIELYFDRDRSEWKWENNHVKMATMYIDPNDYLQKNLVLEEQDKEVKMGHFHLKVGDIEKAREFYVNSLGFNVTAELPGALFISVGGYHHHLGLNVWESSGSPERTNSLGLEKIELILPDEKDYDLLKKRLRDTSIAFVEDKKSLLIYDPWKNQILVTF